VPDLALAVARANHGEHTEAFLRLCGLHERQDVLDELLTYVMKPDVELMEPLFRLGARIANGHRNSLVGMLRDRMMLEQTVRILNVLARRPDWFDALEAMAVSWWPAEDFPARLRLLNDTLTPDVVAMLNGHDVIAWRAFVFGRHPRDDVTGCRDLMRVIARFVLPRRCVKT
jgi:hypothetical protein